MDLRSDTASPTPQEEVDEALGLAEAKSEELRRQFGSMYHILKELKERNLLPAIQWGKDNRQHLDERGSDLLFELVQMQFIHLFITRPNKTKVYGIEALTIGQACAVQFAREQFPYFRPTYWKKIQLLAGALAFRDNLADSPYRRTFFNEGTWDHLADSFTREFCSLLGLSADSPLYIAATAGAIALPTLLKLQTIMKEKRTEWTTQQELPVCSSFFSWYVIKLIELG